MGFTKLGKLESALSALLRFLLEALRKAKMSQNNTDPGHGNSVASWTTVIVIMAAFALATVFFWFGQYDLVYASAALIPFALILGFVLRKAGYGVGGSKTKSH